MDMEFKSGQTVLGTKVNGERIKLMEKGSFGMLMGMSLTENGRTIKQMDMESTLM